MLCVMCADYRHSAIGNIDGMLKEDDLLLNNYGDGKHPCRLEIDVTVELKLEILKRHQ